MMDTEGALLTERWSGARNIAFSHKGRDQNGHETNRESWHEPPPIRRPDDERPASAIVPPDVMWATPVPDQAHIWLTVFGSATARVPAK